jgi:hypothetical protein
VDAASAPGDGRKHDFRRRYGKVDAVMLAEADEVDADLVGQYPLVDDIPDHLRVR